jgi:hypothetical protein
MPKKRKKRGKKGMLTSNPCWFIYFREFGIFSGKDQRECEKGNLNPYGLPLFFPFLLMAEPVGYPCLKKSLKSKSKS